MRPLAPELQSLGWALLNFLWQGLVVWGVTALALRLVRTPQGRYLLACTGLLACLAWPLATFLLDRASGAPPMPAPPMRALIVQAAGVATGLSVLPWGLRLKAWVMPLLPAVCLAWAAGAALLGFRTAGGWLWVQRLRWAGLTASGALQERTLRLAKDLGLTRRVRIRLSRLVEMPVVLGALRPLILVPAAVATGLSPEALDLILVHELAHVRRLDYLLAKLLFAAGLPFAVMLAYIALPWGLSMAIAGLRGPVWPTAPLYLVPAALVVSALMGAVTLGASSLASSPKAGFGWALGIIIGSGALALVASNALGDPRWQALALGNLTKAWPGLFLGVETGPGLWPTLAGTAFHLVLWTGLALHRTRPSEAAL